MCAIEARAAFLKAELVPAATSAEYRMLTVQYSRTSQQHRDWLKETLIATLLLRNERRHGHPQTEIRESSASR